MAREADGDVRLDGAVEITGKLGVGIDPASIGASHSGVQAGSSSNDAAVGGTLYATTTATGNVGTGTDTIASYTVPANTLSANNQQLVLNAYGETASNANAKTLAASFGGASLFAGNFYTNTVSRWRLEIRVYRTGATSAKWVATIWTNDNLNFNAIQMFNGTISPTLSSSNAFLVQAIGVSNDDVVCEAMSVEWMDANT